MPIGHAVRLALMQVLVMAIATTALATDAVQAPKAASAPALVEDRYENEWFYKVRPLRTSLKRSSVVSLTIDEVGQGSPPARPGGEPPCASFKPTVAQVRQYLARAQRISKADYLHETTYSNCSANGRFRTKGGTEGQWMVARGGAGILWIAGARHYLNCEECALVGL